MRESSGMASLKAAGRAFSFGRKKAESQLPAGRPGVEHAVSDGGAHYSRDRAYTESTYASESTATPPKIMGSGLDFGSTDNFGRMFEGFGKRNSQVDLGSQPGSLGLGIDPTESPGRIPPMGSIRTILGLLNFRLWSGRLAMKEMKKGLMRPLVFPNLTQLLCPALLDRQTAVNSLGHPRIPSEGTVRMACR